MNFLNYLLQTNLYLLLFMAFYMTALRNETYFKQNRIFLNISVILSFLIPFMNSDWFRNLLITEQVRQGAIFSGQRMYEIVVIADAGVETGWTTSDLISTVYIAGAVILLGRLLIRLVRLTNNLEIAKGKAFSFFKTMVVDPAMDNSKTIIDHEQVHMKQWHSADILLIELAAIINWFNPVMYLYKKEIRHIHEFIADEEAASLMNSKSDYATLLFTNTLGVHTSALSNNFFNTSLLKRRIIMLNKTKSGKAGLWKYGFSAPLFALMLIVSAAVAGSDDNQLSLNSSTTVDALERIKETPLAQPEEVVNPADVATNNIAAGIANETSAPTPGATETRTEPVIKQAISDQQSPDYSELKRQLQRTLKYPSEARAANQPGFAVVIFTTANRKITNSRVHMSMSKAFESEALRVFQSFDGEVNVPDGNHTIALLFTLIDGDVAAFSSPASDAYAQQPNYAGEIRITAMGRPAVTANTGQTHNFGVDGGKIAQFKGGQEGWVEYLKQNLRYPKAARDSNVTGRVIMSMLVEKDGTLTDIKVLRGIGGGCDEEAVRVLKASPKWEPAVTKEGEPVRVAYTMPIFFNLGSKKP